eukprot:TRINITY_DN7079_c0_g1_i1.p1 TRINITY_DN7079_c0_g1~~TRINITY_DN7079_c0_g1_i1.p1  ORF type:complete len:474 (+),score=109.41 TRINITY_DN7079_c0_g1_i1:159-1580(+)
MGAFASSEEPAPEAPKEKKAANGRSNGTKKQNVDRPAAAEKANGASLPASASDGAISGDASPDVSCPHKLTRTESLDENENEAMEFTDFIENLEREKEGEIEFDFKHRECGLGCTGHHPATTDQFAKVMQEMILKLLKSTPTMKMRIFDNQTVTFSMQGQPDAIFTESRTTQFRRLRAASGIAEEEFAHSICAKPFTGGQKAASGKSGSVFLRSHDNKFVLKTIEQHEFDTLNDILPNYVLYLEENTNSLLCRFYAMYSLKVRNTTLRMVVMANVLPQKAMQVYDLKGTTEDRWVRPDGNAVLKDNNFSQCSMLFEGEDRRNVINTIRDDAEFLESLGLMDYSLLLGVTQVDGSEATPGAKRAGTRCAKAIRGQLIPVRNAPPEERLFQMGIIDYLQRWTPRKVAAFWLKKPTLGCCHEIDTEPPQKYCARFYKYMDRKMLTKIPEESGSQPVAPASVRELANGSAPRLKGAA